MMEILEIPYSDVDAMTDPHIEKSASFTITGNPTVVALKLPSTSHLLMRVPQNVKVGDQVTLLTNFSLAIIPKDTVAEQIQALSDVDKLGGQIITTVGTNIGYTVAALPKGT